jgi:hypothetical protein
VPAGGQPLLQQPQLGRLAGALAALERDEGAGVRPGRRAAAQAPGQVGAQRHARAVVHLPEADDPDGHGQQPADQQGDRHAVDADAERPLAPADGPGDERRRGGDQQQVHPHERLDQPEGAAAQLVLDLEPEQGDAHDVRHAGEGADQQRGDVARNRLGTTDMKTSARRLPRSTARRRAGGTGRRAPAARARRPRRCP